MGCMLNAIPVRRAFRRVALALALCLAPLGAARAQTDAHHEAAALTLIRSGWRVVNVEHGGNLTTLWPLAARGTQGFAWRAAMAETVAPTGAL